MGLRYLDMAAFRATPRASEPFEYLVVPGFVRTDACARINADYPKISERGSFPVAQLAFGPAFQEFLDELGSDEFRTAFEEKFAIDLTGRPSTITVRGQCSPKDGQIHTDSLSKIITVLIYMNPSWEESGGRLRLLRSGDDLDDVITEVTQLNWIARRVPLNGLCPCQELSARLKASSVPSLGGTSVITSSRSSPERSRRRRPPDSSQLGFM